MRFCHDSQPVNSHFIHSFIFSADFEFSKKCCAFLFRSFEFSMDRTHLGGNDVQTDFQAIGKYLR